MRNFLSVSLILIIIYSCSTAKHSTDADLVKGISPALSPCFKDSFEKALYKASLDIKKQHMSGFLLIKKTSDSVIRIVFANEIGMTLFDFGFHSDRFKVHYVFEPMNRKILLRLFEKDFRQLIFGVKEVSSNPIMKMSFQSEGAEGQIPAKAKISNPSIKLNLNITLISQ